MSSFVHAKSLLSAALFWIIILLAISQHSVGGCGDGMFTREEVAQHNKANDLWIIHDGTVHDMTSFVNEHPGGKAILNKAGQDATKVLHTFSPHVKAADFVMKKLNEACIGVLVQ